MRLGSAAGLVLVFVAAPLTAQTVQVWTPIYDTVGTAPRVTSPGYTAWRDTSTGWRVTPLRTVTLTRPDGQGNRVPLDSVQGNDWAQARWRTQLLDDGRVIVARSNPALIELYDATGQFVRTIGRAGAGDSAYQSASSILVDHDTLIVHDDVQNAIRFYQLDGRFIRGFLTGIRGPSSSVSLDPRGRLRVDESRQPALPWIGPRDTTQLALQQAYEEAFRAGAQWRWVYFSRLGLRVDSLVSPPLLPPRQWVGVAGPGSASTFVPPGGRAGAAVRITLTIPYQPHLSATFLRDGTLLAGYTNRFEFVNTRNGRDTLRLFGRSNVEPVAITRPMIDSMLARQIAAGMPQPLVDVVRAEDFPAAFPFWNDVTTDEKGFIWVSTGSWEYRKHYWSIFHPDGRYLGSLGSRFEQFSGASWANSRVAVVLTRDRRPTVWIYEIDRRGM